MSISLSPKKAASPQPIYLIRHALPDWTRTELPYHLPPGPPLCAHGLLEAGQLGNYLRQAGIRHLFVSPLERAWHTAQIISRLSGASSQVEEKLIEWQPDDSQESVHQRTWQVFEQARKLSQEIGPVGLVTHGGPIAMLLLALGMDQETLVANRVFDHGNPVPTAGVWMAQPNGIPAAWELRLVFQPANAG